jgi:hypothetical protein
LRRKRRLEPRHKSVLGGEPETGGERIAQRDDMKRGLGDRKVRVECAKEQHTTGRSDLVEHPAQPI